MKRDNPTMNANHTHEVFAVGDSPTPKTNLKRAWVQRYADRMFAVWAERQTCLGVTRCYIRQLRQELAEWYDEPLKKMFIEATY